MRSVPAGSFGRISSVESLWAAWLAYRQGKRRRPSVASFDRNADMNVFKLHRALSSGRYRPHGYRIHVIREPKIRVVAAPAMLDRVVQRALLDEIAPVYERGFIDHSYAVGNGRGPQRALLYYLACMRRYRWRLSLDIRRYFLSVRHSILLALFARRLRDAHTVRLIHDLLQAGASVYQTPRAVAALGLADDPVPVGCGLPLGGYLSHWSGGLYLDGLDHYVKRTLKVSGYLRYMDDFALFGDDRSALLSARSTVQSWLAQERGLALKPGRQAVRPTSEAHTFLGFRVSRAGVLPGPKAKRRLKSKLRTAAAMKVFPHQRIVRVLQSYQALTMSL